jgi:hypothetical protein
MATIWLFQNASRPTGRAANSDGVVATHIEACDHEETGTRTYEALDDSGLSPRSIGRYQTFAEAQAACQRHQGERVSSPRDAARPTEPHEQLKRLLAGERAKA